MPPISDRIRVAGWVRSQTPSKRDVNRVRTGSNSVNDKRNGPLIADLEGIELSQLDREVLRHPSLGGLILFSRNYAEPQQLRDLIRCVRECRPNLLVSVDQEGGRVQRFRSGFTRLPAMHSLDDLYRDDRQRAVELAADLAYLMAWELRQFDVDVSYAPVLDLADSRSRVIGDRAFSGEVDTVIELAAAFIEGMSGAGMRAVGKHFPGHGGVLADSHLELPVDSRVFDAIAQRDLRCFSALFASLPALMSAHILFPEVDEHPVSFSSYWLQDILRDRLGYEGLVISDDLSMAGASCIQDSNDRVERALEAGCDAVLFCNQRSLAERALENIESKQLGHRGALERLRARQRSVRDADPSRVAAIRARITQIFGE